MLFADGIILGGLQIGLAYLVAILKDKFLIVGSAGVTRFAPRSMESATNNAIRR